MRITDEVSTYTTGGKRYAPGDEVDIDPSAFRADFMVKVEKSKPTKKEERVVVTKEGIETLGPGEEPSAPKIKPTQMMSVGDLVCQVCGTSYGDMSSTEPQVCPKCGAKKVEPKPTPKRRRKKSTSRET